MYRVCKFCWGVGLRAYFIKLAMDPSESTNVNDEITHKVLV